jgi:hypothetical protein
MVKITTYICDCCVIVYPLDELEAVQVYVFSPWNDPTLIDYEMVCPNCRAELEGLIKKWLGGKPGMKKKQEDTVVEQPMMREKAS